MNIGIIGAGQIGLTVAQLSASAGHAVAISNSRDPASLAASIQRVGFPFTTSLSRLNRLVSA